MAPEQARGDAFDRRADLFSLGTVLYTLLAGESPFHAPTMPAVLRRISDEEAVPLRVVAPGASAWLEALVGSLHAKDPAQRPASAGAVADLLEQYIEHRQRPDDVAPPEIPGYAPRVHQRRTGGTMLPALVMVGLAAAGAFAWHSNGSRPVATAPGTPDPHHATPPLPPCPPEVVIIPGDSNTCARLQDQRRCEEKRRQLLKEYLRLVEELKVYLPEEFREYLRVPSNMRTTRRPASPRYGSGGCT
jgi:hypothetical protein